MEAKLKNLVFVSGSHGSGKSTLISKLVEKIPNAVSPELRTRTPQFYWGGDEEVMATDFFNRQALKYAQRAIENYEYLAAAKKEPDKLVIGDRCVFDAHAYRAAGIKLGWLNKEQDLEIERNLRILNQLELLNPSCVILNPGFEVCKEHLEKRWKETGWVKFMERDLGYLRAVCECFEEFQGREGFFYIGDRPDYSESHSLDGVVEWLKDMK